jgi:hypothetical protein
MRFIGPLVACAFLAAPAGASTYLAELHGVVSQQIDLSFSDPHVKLGDVYTITARFDDSMIEPYWSTDGTQLIAAHAVSFQGAPLTGDFSFKVEGSGFEWSSFTDRLDGARLFFDNGKVSGFSGDLLPAETDERPGIESSGPALAHIYGGENTDLNNYKSPGFWVTWDLDGSKVTAVPEPASWAMMIAGFGLVGGGLRRRAKGVIAKV